MDGDWKETGTCHYLIAKEPFNKVLPAALGFPKGSRYTDPTSKGLDNIDRLSVKKNYYSFLFYFC